MPDGRGKPDGRRTIHGTKSYGALRGVVPPRSVKMTGLHVCILPSQYFGWGTYGGFGSMSRKLAESLVKAGVQASVILPRRKGQRPLEWIEGVEVRSFPAMALRGAMELIRESPADIFHSQDPTLL